MACIQQSPLIKFNSEVPFDLSMPQQFGKREQRKSTDCLLGY
jgi:hypothetical protein